MAKKTAQIYCDTRATWGKSRLALILATMSTTLLSGCNLLTPPDAEDGAIAPSVIIDPPLNSTFSVAPDEIVLVMPDMQEREESQVMVTYLTKLLSEPKATREQRAQIFYQLGILYDRLGLEAMARSMFMSALVEVPDFAPAYNFLGIYLASAERFAEAYDAYDAVLELTPEDDYAHFNRGIALYYGQRPKLGIPDLELFYEKNKDDPFRSLWLYLLEREVIAPEEALAHLKERRDLIDPEVPWGTEVLDFYLGKLTEPEVIAAICAADLDNAEMGRRLCEAYFYLGKQADYEGDYKRAYDLFHLCITTGVTGYLEYRYAQLEIARYQRMEQVAKAEAKAKRQQEERLKFLQRQAEEGHRFFEQKHLNEPSGDSKAAPNRPLTPPLEPPKVQTVQHK